MAWKKGKRMKENTHQEVLTLKSTPNKHPHKRTNGRLPSTQSFKRHEISEIAYQKYTDGSKETHKMTFYVHDARVRMCLCVQCVHRFVSFYFSFSCAHLKYPVLFFRTTDKSIPTPKIKKITKSTTFSCLASMRF